MSFGHIMLSFLLCAFIGCSRGSHDEPKRRMDSYLADIRSTELWKLKSFNSGYFGGTQNDAFLQNPTSMDIDEEGRIFVVDSKANSVLLFGRDGDLENAFGRRGQAPGEFSSPNRICIYKNYLVINDLNNRKIQFFKRGGEFIADFRTFCAYQSIVINSEGKIITNPVISSLETQQRLIDILSFDGLRIGSFGAPIVKEGDVTKNNMSSLAVSENGDIYLAFRYAPIVRRYDRTGNLLGEYHLDGRIFNDLEKMNSINQIKSRKQKGRRLPYYTLVEKIALTDKGFYLLKNAPPCMEIIEYDLRGKFLRTYYYDTLTKENGGYLVVDFVIRKKGGDSGDFRAYVLKAYPEPAIEVFCPKY